MLTFIVLACHLNVSEPDENSPNCRKFDEPIVAEMQAEGMQLNPMTCMMQSVPMIVKFEENHPGWQARRWTCKYKKPEHDI